MQTIKIRNNENLTLVDFPKDEITDRAFALYNGELKTWVVEFQYKDETLVKLLNNDSENCYILGNTSNLTNEVVKDFINGRRRELGRVVEGKHNEWDNYNKKYMFSSNSNEAFFGNPLDSFVSLLKSQGIDTKKNYLLVKFN